MRLIDIKPLYEIPTVDAAPVKHGRWINMKNGNANCSVCGQYVVGVYDDDNADKYCRHCGAKMDLGGLKMPIYRRGNCYTCGNESEYLLPEIGFIKDRAQFFTALLCPKCRDIFRKMREENGDFDEKID